MAKAGARKFFENKIKFNSCAFSRVRTSHPISKSLQCFRNITNALTSFLYILVNNAEKDNNNNYYYHANALELSSELNENGWRIERTS